MTVFRPGNIVVDERSTTGDAIHPNTPPDWPNSALWERRMLHWLRLIRRESEVARLVLHDLERPPASGRRPAVYLVRASSMTNAYTDGPIAPGGPMNPTRTEAIFITYSPPDSYGRPVSTAPMDYPPPVLLHELTHALMSVHGMDMPHSVNGVAYPSRGEFLATTIQNMMLSERDAVLADGYNYDDPTIGSFPRMPVDPGPVGVRADRSRSTTDLPGFVAAYRHPLEFFQTGRRRLANRLAALPMAFNPFRELRRLQSATGAGPRPVGTLGNARRPGPVRIP